MPLFTQVSCVYSARADGTTVAALTTAMAAPICPVDVDLCNLMGLTVISDNTVAGGQTVTRTIILSLAQPPFISFRGNNTLQAVSYRPTIRSKSAKDTLTGTGARTVTLNYLNTASVAQAETINLNGTTPVPMLKADYAQINSGIIGPLFGIVINAAGTDGANVGDLVIEHSDSEGRIIPIGWSPAAMYSKAIPYGAVQVDMIGPFMKPVLEGILGLPVVATLPVVFA